MVDQSKILFGLHQINGIGWESIARLMLHYSGHLHHLLEKGRDDLTVTQLDRGKIRLIEQQLTIQFIEQRWEKYKALGIHVLTYLDDDYPKLLREIGKSPWVIYGMGDLSCLKKNTLAIVGTRTPTTYGKRVAADFAQQLSERDWCIVSGMARGIDSIAHHSALQSVGSTIAVLGAGINVVYPPEHTALYEEIGRKGLIISEFPLDTQPRPGLFPLRNRIISGLSYGTLVVEAAIRSGSLITADFALDENRELFAIPGPISSPKSAGTLQLLQKGAKVTTTIKDILDEFNNKLNGIKQIPHGGKKVVKKLTDDEQKILSYLSCEPIKFDDILEMSQFSFGHLHSVLLSLTIKMEIEQLSGGSYVTVN